MSEQAQAVHPSAYPLGKKPAVIDPRTIPYQDLVTGAAEAETAPQESHWGHGLPMTMLGNDQFGDCVEAEGGHAVELWSDRAGALIQPTTAETLAAYTAMTGFNEDDPSTDQGTDMLAAQKYWRSTGIAGIKVDAFASLNPAESFQIQEAVAWYGGASIGLQLPISAQDQTGGGNVWDIVTGPEGEAGSWGGHCVRVTGYNDDLLWVYTWATLQPMTWTFFETYCDEAYVQLSKAWISVTGQSPARLSWGQLSARLANL